MLIFVLSMENHMFFKYCPSLPRLKEVFQEGNGASKSPKKLCYVSPRGPWKPSQPSMMQKTNS